MTYIKSIVLVSFIGLLTGFQPLEQKVASEVCLSKEEQKLYELMMDYRKSKGLPSISLSAKLTLVAQTHAHDLANNYKFDPDNRCNPHSWSRKGKWSSCCYTNDHKQAKCMWAKPKEIAGYEGYGYEIAYYSSKGATAEEGLAGWKLSPGHNPLIINDGMWSKVNWKGVGVGFFGEYGIVWFGEVADETELKLCEGGVVPVIKETPAIKKEDTKKPVIQ